MVWKVKNDTPTGRMMFRCGRSTPATPKSGRALSMKKLAYLKTPRMPRFAQRLTTSQRLRAA